MSKELESLKTYVELYEYYENESICLDEKRLNSVEEFFDSDSLGFLSTKMVKFLVHCLLTLNLSGLFVELKNMSKNILSRTI